MKTSLFLVAILLTSPVFANTYFEQIDAIAKPLNAYLQGHIKGDSEQLGSALHTQGKLSYLREGKYAKIEFPDYLNRMKPRDSNDGVERIPYIRSIEVQGDTAIAKLVLDYTTWLFTDYMTLLKIKGEWKIVNKVAYSYANPSSKKPLNTDITRLNVPLNRYMEFYRTGDSKYLHQAFHTAAKIITIDKDAVLSYTPTEFLKVRKPDATKMKGKLTIERTDITGNVAIASMLREYDDYTVSSYLSLMLIDSEWTIISDVFQYH